MSEAPPQPKGRISLVALLAGALFFELWLNRIAARLVRLDPASRVASALRRVDLVAFFLFEFVSILAAVILAGGLARIVLSSRHRGPTRLSFALVGGVAAILVVAGTLVKLSPRFSAHLLISSIFLMLVIALGAFALPTSRRLRAGIGLLVIPLGMMLLANLLQRFSAPGVLDPTASALAEAAGAALVGVGLLSPWLFAPSGSAGPFAITLATAVAGIGIALGKVDWDSAARLAGIGLGVAIPIGPLALPIYVLGAAAMAFTIGALIVRPGPERLRGIGLFIICGVGLQLELPYQIASSLIGLLCLFEVATLPVKGAISRAELDAQLRQWAGLVGATQVTVVGVPGREHARIEFSTTGGLPATLQLDRRYGAIDVLELSVGEIPERSPPFTVSARSGRRFGPAAPGPNVEVGDETFDKHYAVRDHRGVGTKLWDVPTRAAMLAMLGWGWIGVWPQRGARFRGPTLPPSGLPSLTDLLADLRERSGA